jgi:hypothetical protein
MNELAPSHDSWHELCALATAGALAPAEVERLRGHLSECAECQAMLDEYRAITRNAMPLVAEDFASLDDEVPAWNRDAAKERLFAALDAPEPNVSDPIARAKTMPPRRPAPVALWAGLAASILVAVGVGAFQWGRHSADPAVAQSAAESQTLSERLQQAAAEKTALDARLTAESAREVELEQRGKEAESSMAALEQKLDALTATDASTTQANSSLTQEVQSLSADKTSLGGQLRQAQQDYQTVSTELTNLREQRRMDSLHYASLETEVTDLKHQLTDAQGRLHDDSQYLASDRDVRELMGARQLYIADVVDVDQNGDRRKPFGRVFYTKGKSLIFYAFDLDRQPGVKEASFQAWAREGSDKAQPISLGIFYVDSEANRRWALKADDPKALAQINSVFVTVEPKGGSLKPTGKPLLYAYLRTETPNHP